MRGILPVTMNENPVNAVMGLQLNCQKPIVGYPYNGSAAT